MSADHETPAGLSEACCDHEVRWHHETRGCGYHGHAPANRCPCLLTAGEALEHYVTARLAAQAAAHTEEVAGLEAEVSHRSNMVLHQQRRAESAEAKVAGVEALAEKWEGWAKVRSTVRITAFRDAATDLRAVLATPPTECIFDPPGDCMSPDGLGCPACTPEWYAAPPTVQREAEVGARVLREVKAELERMLNTYPAEGRHTRARWATEYLQIMIDRGYIARADDLTDTAGSGA